MRFFKLSSTLRECSLIAICLLAGAVPAPLFADTFRDEIEPLMRRHCYRCHGSAKQEGGLRLDVADAALRGGDSGPAIQPGNPEQSLLVQRIRNDQAGKQMPCDAPPLSDRDCRRIESWIRSGATRDSSTTEGHWAYTPPVKPKVPEVQHAEAIQNEVDSFLLSKLEANHRTYQPLASPERRIRRLYLALTGLPPSLDVVDRFVADPSVDHYARLVDELMRSPRFAEHWARHWLDLARYADSNGYQADQLRDSWAYRDWVVRAIQQGMPFDQFVVEQLAGDLLPNATMDQRIATGFHRTVTCNVEAGVHPEENRTNQVLDRVNTTGTVFLGTTLECAQCHDHKYDPFSMRDYYQIFAYFNQTPLEVELTSGVTYDFIGPKMEIPTDPAMEARQIALRREADQLEADLESTTDSPPLPDDDAAITALRSRISGNANLWTTLSPQSFHGTGRESYRLESDGSVLIEGRVPDKTVYELVFDSVPASLAAIRLETLTHPQLPGQGPGRGEEARPNFVLHEVELFVRDSAGEEQKVAFSEAISDFAQQKWAARGAIDGDRNSTGWAISPQFGKPHWLQIALAEPLTLTEGNRLVVRLHQNFGKGRTIGCLRLTGYHGPADLAVLSRETVEALSSQQSLSNLHREELRRVFNGEDMEVKDKRRRLETIRAELKSLGGVTTLVMEEIADKRETHVLMRGNYMTPGDRVTPAPPAALLGRDAVEHPANRLGLAQWLTARQNPLLARVTVNRWWSELWGRGLVATPEDFGTQGETPTHPELLDWLATEFMDSGWSMRHVLKQIVQSHAFQQDSGADLESWSSDPENSGFGRGPRFRLPAETIRDNGLAISGLLSDKMFGPPIMPYQPDGVWNSIGRNQPKWKAADDEDRFRRGLYVVWKRAAPYPSFMAFDAPDRAACTVERSRSNTPLQGLVLLNDSAYAEMAVALAQVCLRECANAGPEVVATHMFRRCVARTPEPSELAVLLDLYSRQSEQLANHPELVQQRVKILPTPWREASLDPQAVAAWFAVANALLALDETISL